MAAVVAAVRQALVKEVGRPRMRVQPPGGRTLVNLPVLYSAPAQHETVLQITVPLPGAITADPAYSWDLGDGQHGVGAGHRVHARRWIRAVRARGVITSRASTRQVGSQRSTLTLTWAASIQLGAGAGALTVPLDPITFTATSTIQTVSATNRLYDQVPAPTPS